MSANINTNIEVAGESMVRFLIDKSILLAAIICVCALMSCAPAGSERVDISALDKIVAAKTLRVAVKTDAPPFGFKLGKSHAGFEVDLIAAVAREMGIEQIEFVSVNSSERIQALVSGSVDVVIANMTVTRKREQHIDFSLPYFQDGQMLLVKQASTIKSYLDVQGKTVGCIRDTTGEKNLRVVAPGAQLKVFNTNEAMLQALINGSVDAISTDSIVLEGMRNNNPDAGLLLVGEQFSEEPLAIGLAENQSDLRDAINEALQRIWETGEWQSIYETWFSEASGYTHVRSFHIQTYPQ